MCLQIEHHPQSLIAIVLKQLFAKSQFYSVGYFSFAFYEVFFGADKHFNLQSAKSFFASYRSLQLKCIRISFKTAAATVYSRIK
jgi:hypothetical protein